MVYKEFKKENVNFDDIDFQKNFTSILKKYNKKQQVKVAYPYSWQKISDECYILCYSVIIGTANSSSFYNFVNINIDKPFLDYILSYIRSEKIKKYFNHHINLPKE